MIYLCESHVHFSCVSGGVLNRRRRRTLQWSVEVVSRSRPRWFIFFSTFVFLHCKCSTKMLFTSVADFRRLQTIIDWLWERPVLGLRVRGSNYKVSSIWCGFWLFLLFRYVVLFSKMYELDLVRWLVAATFADLANVAPAWSRPLSGVIIENPRWRKKCSSCQHNEPTHKAIWLEEQTLT